MKATTAMVNPPRVLITWKERGDFLFGIAHVIGPRGVELRFAVRAPLKLIEAKCRQWYEKKQKEMLLRGGAEVGFFGSIAKAVKRAAKKVGRAAKKIAKSKILKTVRSVARKVVKSKITQGLVAATAVAFPAVGIPAAGALAAANMTIDRIDDAKRAIKTAKRLGRSVPAKAKQVLQQANRVVNAAKRGNPRAVKMAKSMQIARRYQKNVARLSAARNQARLAAKRRMLAARGVRAPAPADAMRKLADLQRRALMGDRRAQQQLAGLRRMAAMRRRAA